MAVSDYPVQMKICLFRFLKSEQVMKLALLKKGRVEMGRLIKYTALIMTVAMTVSVLSAAAFAETAAGGASSRSELYAEYLDIAEDVTQETGVPISVVDMKDFTDQDWVSPEIYKAEMLKIAESLDTKLVEENTGARSAKASTTASKVIAVTYDGGSMKVKVTGSFTTVLSESLGRQVFSGIKSITSAKYSGNGTWTDKGYSRTLIDGGRTYSVSVAGTVKIGTNKYDTTGNVFFYCSATGAVS